MLTDEGALVKGAKKLGYVFTGRTPDSVIIDAVSVLKGTEQCAARGHKRVGRRPRKPNETRTWLD